MLSNKKTPTNALQQMRASQKTKFDALIDSYFDSLNEIDGKNRRELIKQVWAKVGKFVSPIGEVKGHAAIDAQIQGFQKQFPGAKVRRTSDVDVLGKNIRFAFEAVYPDGRVSI